MIPLKNVRYFSNDCIIVRVSFININLLNIFLLNIKFPNIKKQQYFIFLFYIKLATNNIT